MWNALPASRATGFHRGFPAFGPVLPVVRPAPLLGAVRHAHPSPQHLRGTAMRDEDLNLLQGTLDLLVLKALVFGARHGYAVARWVRDATDGVLEIEDGALYAALHRIERRGWEIGRAHV